MGAASKKRKRTKEGSDDSDDSQGPQKKSRQPDADAEKKKASQAGDETAYLAWIKRAFPGSFDHFATFKHARAFKQKLADLKLWLEFRAYVQKHVKHVDLNAKDNERILQVQTQAMLMLQHLKQATTFNAPVLPVLKLTMPTNDGIAHNIRTKQDTSTPNAQMQESYYHY